MKRLGRMLLNEYPPLLVVCLLKFIIGIVRMIGLEPTRLTAPDPKSGAAANYATPARDISRLSGSKDRKKFSWFWQIVLQIKSFADCQSPFPFKEFPCFFDDGVHMSLFSSVFAPYPLSCPGSMPNSICCSMSASRCGLAEKRTPHPLGSSEEKGRPDPPPVLSPTRVTLGKQRIGVDEIIGCAIGVTVGQDNYLFLPADTVGRFHINGSRI